MFKNKKNVRIIALTLAAVFLLGVAGIVLPQSIGGAHAAPPSKIGKVDYERIISEYSGMAAVKTRMEAEIDKSQKSFDETTKAMSDEQKQEYFDKESERLTTLEQELMEPILDKINAAIKDVSEAKGLEAVFDPSSFHYGGVDITDEVIQKLN